MHIAAGAFNRTSDNGPVAEFNGTFSYDALQLQVISQPAVPKRRLHVAGPIHIRRDLQRTNSCRFAANHRPVVVRPAGRDRHWRLFTECDDSQIYDRGITTEGTLTASIAAGTILDTFGNPNAAFSANLSGGRGNHGLPHSIHRQESAGLDDLRPQPCRHRHLAGDTDAFTIAVDAGQTISVLVTPSGAGLQPTVQLRDPSNAIIATATAVQPGKRHCFRPHLPLAAGTYTIVVGGAASTAGGYTVQVILNAALEEEANLVGISNDTQATAQNLNGSFIDLESTLSQAQRGGVLGASGMAAFTDYYSFNAVAGDIVTVALSTSPAAGPPFSWKMAADCSPVARQAPQTSTWE